MPTVNLNAILVGVAYAALTGVFNLVLANKSQIEVWATANPRLAALFKFTRAIGFDPWALFASMTLLFAKKLPAAQRADSPVAVRAEETVRIIPSRRPGPPFPPAAALLLLAFVAHSQACAIWKPVARTADGIAEALCGQFFGEKQGISIEEAAKQFCATQDDLRPWIDQVLAAKRDAGKVALARKAK